MSIKTPLVLGADGRPQQLQSGDDLGLSLTPQTTGGPTVARIKSASGTNATLVKSSAGQLFGLDLGNNTTSARWIHFYDSGTIPTAGSGTPKFTLIIPANSGKNIEWPWGIPFSSGIGYTITTGASDTDTGSCSADDVHGLLLYK